MKLNLKEQACYVQKFVFTIPTLAPGTYYISSFFGTDPSIPRVARQFYEDVISGVYPNVKLAGVRSRDGYIIV